ncbi:CHAP domain-containing protein [bacterium D16-51]|nr:CHAP domain-containing protein [bacterium D16-59]RKI60445.1 CHAP domain-containing protein [bacterium D16-51]
MPRCSAAGYLTFTKQADGYYTISNVNSNKLLDCFGAGKANGTNVQQYASNNTSAQRWKVTSVGNGYYTLSCKCNGLFIDAAGGIGANGTNIQMYAANGTLAQRWKLVPTNASSQSNTAQKIVDFELSQIGIGDYKGNNNVIYNTWYYGRAVSGNGYAWCMAFQSYCANQMGVLNSAIPKTASCAEAVKWYKNKGHFQAGQYYGGSYTPKAGDLVFYYNGSFCHVGMITSAPVNAYLQTVEGNIICSDGNYKVVQFTKNNKRTVNSSYVYGYGTPAY